MPFEPGTILCAHQTMPIPHAGYVYNGVGIYKTQEGSPKGRRPPKWALIHLGSGHRICIIAAHFLDACHIAYDIANLGDWSFDGIKGWKNVDPELPRKLEDYAAKDMRIELTPGKGNENAARAVLMSRVE